ncbi:ATP-binding cassette [Lithospermum erythrorhizon]|uniref:ATP-binding cassette n=1 Tax=Lithospermum erythrorhizon TaxID=34254 RepID=A0AAV3RJE7_LITER
MGDNIEMKSQEISNGVFLTWEDLWVTVSLQRKGSKSILQGVTGYARPGELLAVMGPSGSGKSTLLDALAGRLGSNTRQTGNLLINGCEQRLAYGTLAYVMQDEALIATLSVKEALYYSASLQLPNSMTNSEKKQRAETVIKEMGLKQAMNTRVGGWGVRGLSGGQKRRLSICIEILGHPKLLFLDEPTSGLDSAGSYYVMSSIACQKMERTVIATIHQPSAEIFNLFDNVCLLSSGRNVYFGSTREVNQFFASNGFPCPGLQNQSDHFLQTINADFDEDIELGLSQRRPTEEVTHLLIKGYNSSNEYQNVLTHIGDIRKQKGAPLESRTRANFRTQCSILTRRSFLNMSRDYGYYWMRLAMQIMIAIALGSIYFDVGYSYGSIQARGSMLMYVATFFTYMSIGGFPSFLEDMKVFKRERLNGHYGPSAFVISHTLSSIPYLLLTSTISGVIAYYLTGLQNGIVHFIYFTLIVFISSMIVESLQMLIASLVPNFLLGLIIVSGIQGMMMLGGGFFRLPNDLPKPFWKYPVYFIAFHKYAYQGLYKNEFIGLLFSDRPYGGSHHHHKLNGTTILRDVWQVDLDYSKWVDLSVLIGMVIMYRLMFILIMKIKENLKLMRFYPMKKNIVTANPDGSPLVGINHVQMAQNY